MKHNYIFSKSIFALALGFVGATAFGQNQIQNAEQSTLATKMIDARTGQQITAQDFNSIYAENIVSAKTNVTWQGAGPNNLGGRFRALLASSATDIWAGSVTGGLFHSTDGGNTWSRVTNYSGSAYISSITKDMNGNIYVATGSKYEIWEGNGIHFSSDNGVTWQSISGTDVFTKIDRVVSSEFTDGIYFSTDYGLKKWTPSSNAITDVGVGGMGPINGLTMSADGEVIVLAVTADTYVSSDAGTTWANVSGSSLSTVPNSGFGRIEYAISAEKADGTHSIYATLSESNLVGGWLSKDDGATWEQHTGTPTNLANLNVYNYQGLQNSSLAVNPNNEEEVLIGGNNLFSWEEQTNSPLSGDWNQISSGAFAKTNPQYMQNGINVIDWHDGQDIFFATNGGVFFSDDNAVSFLAANRNLTSTQFYSIAFDRTGNILGGTSNNGTVYNSHVNQNVFDYISANYGANFETEISFFNPQVLLTAGPYNTFYRSVNAGGTFESFEPDLPAGYTPTGDNVQHPYHSEFVLAEYFDENSEDSVVFYAFDNYVAGDIIPVLSKSTGDTIMYTTPVDLEFSDELYFNPSLTTTDYIVSPPNSSAEFDLGTTPFTYLNSSSTAYPPAVGDSLLIEGDTVVVGQVTPYTHYFGTSSQGEVFDMGQDTMVENVVWDTIMVQDPYQSWFVFTSLQNGGEVWGSRDVLRISEGNPKWVKLADNMGTGEFDMEFSSDLNHLFIASGGEVVRLTGLSDVYSSDDNFEAKLNMDSSAVQVSNTVISGANYVAGIGLDPENPSVLVGVRGQFNGGVVRCDNALSPAPSFTELSTPAMALYDVIVDRNNDQLLVAGGAWEL